MWKSCSSSLEPYPSLIIAIRLTILSRVVGRIDELSKVINAKCKSTWTHSTDFFFHNDNHLSKPHILTCYSDCLNERVKNKDIKIKFAKPNEIWAKLIADEWRNN